MITHREQIAWISIPKSPSSIIHLKTEPINSRFRLTSILTDSISRIRFCSISSRSSRIFIFQSCEFEHCGNGVWKDRRKIDSSSLAVRKIGSFPWIVDKGRDLFHRNSRKIQLTRRGSGANPKTRLTRIKRKQGCKFFHHRHLLIESWKWSLLLRSCALKSVQIWREKRFKS